MIWAVIDKRVIDQRIARKVERAAGRIKSLPATGTQAVLRCAGVVVVGANAWLNVLLETNYPYPAYEIETGVCAIVSMNIAAPKELVN